jgi:hypothetical protein
MTRKRLMTPNRWFIVNTIGVLVGFPLIAAVFVVLLMTLGWFPTLVVSTFVPCGSLVLWGALCERRWKRAALKRSTQ